MQRPRAPGRLAPGHQSVKAAEDFWASAYNFPVTGWPHQNRSLLTDKIEQQNLASALLL